MTRYIQHFSRFVIFHIISLFFYLLVSTTFFSGDNGIVLGSSISGFRDSINQPLLRRDIFSPNEENDFPLIAQSHQNLPIEPDEQNPSEPSPEPPPEQQPATDPIPQPQPGPAPEPDTPRPNALPKPQPIIIDPSQPGGNVPVPVDPSRPLTPGNLPAPGPVGVPIVPAPPIIIVPPNQRSRRPLPAPQPLSGFEHGSRPIPPAPQQPTVIQGPDVSDYPSDEQIRRDILRVPRDATVMYTEIGGLYPVRLFAERFNPPKMLYLDAFPYGYTFSNGRSGKWYMDFLDRLCAVFSDLAVGIVYLVSKYPYGPESTCSMWSRIEYDALKANIDVDEIWLVDHTDINRQRLFWSTQYGEVRWDNQPHPKRDMVAPCPAVDGMYSGYPDVLPGTSVDLTPIMGAASGVAYVIVVQHRKTSSTAVLDVSILNAKGEQIGTFDHATVAPGEEVVVQSKLPFAVRIVGPASDDEPLQIRYGDMSMFSDDISKCSVDPWKSDVREVDCNFDY